MQETSLDRSRQDVGNILILEHLNVTMPDQQLATIFYVMGLGLTRDPYLMVGVDNMWINVGQQQFHLPTAKPQVTPGFVDLILPDLEALTGRLETVRPLLAGTKFAWSVEDKHVLVTCPWGNRIRCHPPAPEHGDVTLGMLDVEFPVAPGAAPGIARFYETVMEAPATVTADNGLQVARVHIGWQSLVFRETKAEVPPYDGHHVAMYISNFSRPHKRLLERGLISMENGQYEWRFKDIVDLDSGKVLHRIEHEVRSATNPLFMRPLVNRNPAQRQRTYVRGRDPFVPGMA